MKLDRGTVKRNIQKEEDDGRFRGRVWNGEIEVLGEIRNSSVRGVESRG